MGYMKNIYKNQSGKLKGPLGRFMHRWGNATEWIFMK
jgi:hypothetical protein